MGAKGVESVLLNGRDVSHVQPLSALDPAWSRSQFVRIGNPHCVTLLESADALPSNEQMRERGLSEGLTRIAYAMPTGAGEPCAAGVNLEWAMFGSEGRVVARVFERGERPTASSAPAPVRWLARRGGWVGSVQGK